MLTCLRVRGLAVIESLDLDLVPGLNIITGETGAGKSILVEALKLVAGGRGRGDIVRAGAAEAEIEALFDVSATPTLGERLEEMTGRRDDELVVRRVLRPEGRSRAWINGTIATAVQLSALTRGLVDICSQHEHHTLVDPSSHLRYLDAFARLDARRARVMKAWEVCAAAIESCETASMAAADSADREAVVRMQLDEIRAVDPQPTEREELEGELARLSHAERLTSITAHAEQEIYARDGAITDLLSRVHHQLAALRGIDPELDRMLERVDTIRTDLEDVAAELGRYSRGLTSDPSRLQAVQDRLAHLRRLERRHGGSITSLLEHRSRLEAELHRIEHMDDHLDALEAVRQRATADLVNAAKELSAERIGAASRMGEAITSELASLGMGRARVEVDVGALDQRGGGVEIDGVRYSSFGRDRVELLIAPNPGEPPRPLIRIASGGELSRSLLAIKRVLAEGGPAGLYVFDEVDAGIGGGVAEVIGRKLSEVARHHQVLCITHLAPIAAFGEHHVHVHKVQDATRTQSAARALSVPERIEELARMMGGLVVTDATRAAAADLLQQARS